MTSVTRSIEIDRPMDEVFEFVHDLTKEELWQTTLVESEQLTDGPMRVGTRVRQVRHFLGLRIPMEWEVTEYEPNNRSAIKSVSGPVPLKGSYVLQQQNGGTKLTVSGELDAHGLFKLAEPVFARITGRELESNLGHLKDLLEAEKEPS